MDSNHRHFTTIANALPYALSELPSHIPAYRGYRPSCTHYAKERDYSPLFVMYFTGTYMVSIVQVQANCSCFGSIVFALFWLYTASAAPAALQIHTVFRFPDLGRDTACRQFKPDFYIPLLARGLAHELALAPWPLVLRLSPRPAWAKIRNSLPRRLHAGLGTYPAQHRPDG